MPTYFTFIKLVVKDHIKIIKIMGKKNILIISEHNINNAIFTKICKFIMRRRISLI